MPSVRDFIEEKTMDDRPGAQCKRLKRKDTGHENIKSTNNANRE